MAESIISSTADALLRRMTFRKAHAHRVLPLALSSLVEEEVIPRLHRPASRIEPAAQGCGVWGELDGFVRQRPPPPPEIGHRDVTLVAKALLKQDLHGAWRVVKTKFDAGVDSERLAVELLGPVARHLGELWEADRCSFADVTLGAGYLHQLLRDVSTCLDHSAETPGYHHRVLLLPAPGEQHILGLSILGESFRRRGWDVCGGPAQDRAELRELIRREHFDLIGFSVGADRWLEGLSLDIEQFRRQSRNGNLQVLVGGFAIERRPQLVTELGAHLSVSDARLAPDAALSMLEESEHP
ncbi:MAG: cobalamin B12-binding domain-containing protein [Pseudomonadales bacterium]